MVRATVLATVVLCEAGCARSRPSTAWLAADRECPPAPPATWHAFRPESAAALAPQLAGIYELLTVATTRGMQIEPSRTQMRLAVTDSSERNGVVGFGPDGRKRALWDQPLTAYFDIPNQTSASRAQYVYRLRDGALVQDERHLCNDCSATVYWLEAVGPSGLWGRWEHSFIFGGIKVKGRDGRWHETVGGRFCAERVAPDSVPRG